MFCSPFLIVDFFKAVQPFWKKKLMFEKRVIQGILKGCYLKNCYQDDSTQDDENIIIF